MNKAWPWFAPLTMAVGCFLFWNFSGTDGGESLAPSQTAEAASTDAANEGVQFIEGYYCGHDMARQTSKPMLVFFTFEGCEYCHQLAQEAFVQANVVELSKQFICVRVNLDKEAAVCQDFRVRFYPTIQFISPRGVPLNRVTGKQPATELMLEMQAALQAVARRVDPVTDDTMIR